MAWSTTTVLDDGPLLGIQLVVAANDKRIFLYSPTF